MCSSFGRNEAIVYPTVNMLHATNIAIRRANVKRITKLRIYSREKQMRNLRFRNVVCAVSTILTFSLSLCKQHVCRISRKKHRLQSRVVGTRWKTSPNSVEWGSPYTWHRESADIFPAVDISVALNGEFLALNVVAKRSGCWYSLAMVRAGVSGAVEVGVAEDENLCSGLNGVYEWCGWSGWWWLCWLIYSSSESIHCLVSLERWWTPRSNAIC